jgi:hypothetical protein
MAAKARARTFVRCSPEPGLLKKKASSRALIHPRLQNNSAAIGQKEERYGE